MTEKQTSPPLARGFDLKRDLLASIVVFLVALPLCIGIALAVGVNPGRALITGIIGGIIVGVLGGCPLQVCGPAAGLFVIVADAILKQKTLFATSIKPDATDAEAMAFALLALGFSVMLAGVFQFTAGQLKLGQWFRAVSPSVIEGMLGGIGILIFASQFHVMFDHEPLIHGKKAHGGLQYLQILPNAIQCCWEGSPLPSEKPVKPKDGARAADDHGPTPTKPVKITPFPAAQHSRAAMIGITTILIIVLWGAYVPKQLKLIPGALVAILVAIAIVLLGGWQVKMLEVSGNIRDDISLPTLDSLRLIVTSWPALLSAVSSAAIIAVVASAETLLCATAVDQMHSGERTKYDKELTAHGFGNPFWFTPATSW
jgi:MFS superfamily sulfate permease-like transporter